MANRSFLIKPTAGELVEEAARCLVQYAHQCVEQRGRFTFALAGGSTPQALYQLLAGQPWRSQMPWKKSLILFGDERAVPPEDARSNYHMAAQDLLNKIEIPPENIRRMRGESEDLEEAARDYEALLKSLNDSVDLTLLGMGPDGHTASLFPHSPQLAQAQQLCVATPQAPLEPHVRRLTLTYSAINASRRVWVLVTGEGKAERLRQVLEGAYEPQQLPIQGVQPFSGDLVWMLDAAAAQLLRKSS